MNFLADWISKRFITHQNLINCFSNSYRTSPIALNGQVYTLCWFCTLPFLCNKVTNFTIPIFATRPSIAYIQC